MQGILFKFVHAEAGVHMSERGAYKVAGHELQVEGYLADSCHSGYRCFSIDISNK